MLLVPLLKRILVILFEEFAKKAVVPLQLAILFIQKYQPDSGLAGNTTYCPEGTPLEEAALESLLTMIPDAN